MRALCVCDGSHFVLLLVFCHLFDCPSWVTASQVNISLVNKQSESYVPPPPKFSFATSQGMSLAGYGAVVDLWRVKTVPLAVILSVLMACFFCSFMSCVFCDLFFSHFCCGCCCWCVVLVMVAMVMVGGYNLLLTVERQQHQPVWPLLKLNP
jgi:hypothetical protein